MLVRAWLVGGATIGALAVVYAVLSPDTRAPAPGAKTYRLALRSGRLVSEPAVFRAVEGDAITLSVTSDRSATLHVHEYEQEFVVPLVPNVTATARFTAARSGRFPVHVIGIDPWHPEVALIQVEPR
jgi:hypothetical protein